jgi:hypothetical protein
MPMSTFRPSYGGDVRYVSMDDAEDFVLSNHRRSKDFRLNHGLNHHVHDRSMNEISSQESADDTSVNCFEGRHFYEVNEALGDKILANEIATNSVIQP